VSVLALSPALYAASRVAAPVLPAPGKLLSLVRA